MSTKIGLSVKELQDILELCKAMNVENCTLVQDCSSGIGCSLTVEIKTVINNYFGNFVVDFTDVDEW